jgi:signal transduction histidine kinase
MVIRSGDDDERELFGALAAHELRTPAHAILSYLSVILRERAGPLTPVQRDFLDNAYRAGRRLERLIEDVQVMIAGERGFSIKREPVDLRERVTAGCRELAQLADELGVGLAVDSGRGGDDWRLIADPLRLDQIIVNLVENALRYAEPGSSARVRLRCSPARVLCVITNTAEQTPDDDPASWFMPFQRGSTAATSHGERGRGLGLAVVDQLVTAHNGRICTRVRGREVTIAVLLPRGDR